MSGVESLETGDQVCLHNVMTGLQALTNIEMVHTLSLRRQMMMVIDCHLLEGLVVGLTIKAEKGAVLSV